MEQMNKMFISLATFLSIIFLFISCTSQQDNYKKLLQIVNNTNKAIEKSKDNKVTPYWDEYCIWDSCGIRDNLVYFYVHMNPKDVCNYTGRTQNTRKAKFLFDIVYSEDLWQQIQWFKDAKVGLALRIANANISDVIVSPDEVSGWNFYDKVGNAVSFLSSLVEEENQKIKGSKSGCVEMTFDGTTLVYHYLYEDSIVEKMINDMEDFKEEMESNYKSTLQHDSSVYTNISFDISNIKKHANVNSLYIFKSIDSDKTFTYKVSAFGKLLECSANQ